MKKYLIKGVLALFGGAFLFSCAEKESEYVPLAQQKVKAFEEVFKEVYGDIDPYQDWGFNSAALKLDPSDPSMVMEVIDISDGEGAETRAATRANLNMNGNQWRTCPTLGDSEESDVTAYVNHTRTWLRANNKPFYEVFPVNITDYYVTQVHCGTDTYTNNDGGAIGKGSSHMNHLMIKEKSDKTLGDLNGKTWKEGAQVPDFTNTGWFHVNNFNRGDNTDWKGNTLVGDAGTYDFAYHGTEDAKYHNRWIAVKGSDINAAKYGNYWYICFDFEAFVDNPTTGFRVNVTNPYRSENYSDWIEIPGYYTSVDQLIGYQYKRKVYNPTTNSEVEYTYTLTEANISDLRVINGNQCVAPNDVYTDWIIRLVPAAKKVPSVVPDTTIVEYWIPLEAGRVFCEDLGRASREDLDYNDLVFDARTWRYEKWNIIWDLHYNDSEDTNPASRSKKDSTLKETKFYADIKLLAAGGTIPITILNKRQVHSLFKEPADIATMINTRDNNSNVYGSFDVRSAVAVGDKVQGDTLMKFKTKGGDRFELWLIPGYEHIKDIPIVSSFDGQQVAELNANQGEAPHKILVEYGTTKWVSERKNLALAYPNFSKYVTGEINKTGWVKEGINTDYLYDQPVENEYSPAPMIIKSTKEIVGNSELTIWESTHAFGKNWNYASMDSPYEYYMGTKFFPGDRIRFHGIVTAEGDDDQPYISVTFVDDSKPYLVDTQFAERKKKIENGKEVWYYPSTAYVEVLLDEYFCSKLNNSKNDAGQLTLHVQGRGFTLTKIGYVPFQ